MQSCVPIIGFGGPFDGVFSAVTEARDLKFGGRVDCVRRRMSVKFDQDRRFSFLASNHFSIFFTKTPTSPRDFGVTS